MSRLAVTVSIALIAGLLGGLLTPGPITAASAATGSDFDPGQIISDAAFFDRDAMSTGAIQSFLERQVPTCSSRATAPCLKSYTTPTGPKIADRYCSGYTASENESAATIIYRVAQSCGISPKVLLVTLQKEQALVTSTSPTPSTYRIAMGYGCPDTAACDTQYYGFFNQVYSAARQYQVYTLNSTIWRYQPGRNNSVYFHPNAACGSSQVFIRNQATANLYIYTPYQPNSAALANLYGSGDTCSAYGNRNFWRIFSDWFGSPVLPGGTTAFISSLYIDTLGRRADAGELRFWELQVSRGLTFADVSRGFLVSTEHRTRAIRSAYTEYLQRSANDFDTSFWLSQYGSQITGQDELLYYIAQSDEYFGLAGRDQSTLIANLYRDVLGRPARPDEIEFWVAQMAQIGQANSIFLIWDSSEANAHRIGDLYTEYLGRSAGPGDTDYWTPISRVGSDFDVLLGITRSVEYFNRTVNLYPR